MNFKKSIETVLITGRMGAGKSEVLNILASKGCPVFRADRFAGALLKPKSPCFKDLKGFLDPSCFNSQGQIDRKKLASEIFKNPVQKHKLESLVHPLVQEGFEDFIKEQKNKGEKKVFYEAPLLSSSLLESRFDHIVLVRSPENLSLERLKKRGFQKEEVFLRWKNQSLEKDILHLVDNIINNDGSMENLQIQTDKILSLIEKKQKNKESSF